MVTTKEVFAEIGVKMAQNSGRLAGLNAIYQFVLSGEDGGTWQVKIADSKGVISEGTPDKANCTVTMSVADFKDMAAGKLNGTAAFMSGRLRIAGDMALAMKLQTLIG
ncbi:MAG TPA: SCP2 sterol-binding domain-containing protein [Bacillota bacterium]